MLNWIIWNRNVLCMLNWIIWNRTVLCMLTWIIWNRTILCMLNWIIWNRTVYMYKNGFGFNNLQWLLCDKTKPNPRSINFLICACLIYQYGETFVTCAIPHGSPSSFSHTSFSTLSMAFSCIHLWGFKVIYDIVCYLTPF